MSKRLVIVNPAAHGGIAARASAALASRWREHGDTVVQNQYGERNSILIVEEPEKQVAL